MGQIAAFGQGVAFVASLLVSIGPQNANLLRRGLRGHWAFTTALVCTICDLALISLGVGGFGTWLATQPVWARAAAWGGSLFLAAYALKAFHDAWHPRPLDLEGATQDGAWAAILAALGFSLLNPHVYLDTVVLVGGMAAQHPLPARMAFGGGAMLGAALWFFSLAFGARTLAGFFRRPLAWRILDLGVGLLSLYLAIAFLLRALAP